MQRPTLGESYESLDRERHCAALVGLGVPSVAAAALAQAFPGLRGLGAASCEAIAAAAGARGVPAWTRRIAAAFALVRTADAARDGYRSRVRTPTDAADYLRGRGFADHDREHFGILILDARQRITSCYVVAIGHLAQVDVHPREVFAEALTRRAHSVILFHNHPSGDPEPSEADIEITRRLADVGRMVGIPVLDHVIVAGRESQSLAALGLTP